MLHVQQMYSKMRYIFSRCNMSKSAQFRTHSTPSSASAVPIYRCGLSDIECRPVQRVQRPGVCVVPCVARPGLVRSVVLPAVAAVCPGALGAGVSTGGVYSRRPAPPGQSRHHRKNKKGSKKSPHPLFPISKISRKNKKTPTKGLCSVLYLPYKP